VPSSQSDIGLSKQIYGLIIKSGTSLVLYAGSALVVSMQSFPSWMMPKIYSVWCATGIWNAMKTRHTIELGTEYYVSMFNLFGRHANFMPARILLKGCSSTSCNCLEEPAAAVWRSLRSACHLFGEVCHWNSALGDPADSGPSVLMPNIYVSKGLWVDARKLWHGIDCASVVKEPGYSWIELTKEVHNFIARGQ
jgi:hypothetical protein